MPTYANSDYEIVAWPTHTHTCGKKSLQQLLQNGNAMGARGGIESRNISRNIVFLLNNILMIDISKLYIFNLNLETWAKNGMVQKQDTKSCLDLGEVLLWVTLFCIYLFIYISIHVSISF